uniref:Autophagy-related protein 18d-like n=1 Tax=Piliocolobus tephrosceles TaxID=591936 RepID=A0A8C9H4T2_9PRIM
MVSLRLDNNRYIAFNQDYSCLCMANEKGFKIYNTNPFAQTYSRDLTDRNKNGLYIAEMLYRCNILAITGNKNDRKGKWSKNVLIIWDDRQMREIAKLTFPSNIIGVRLLREIIVVILEYKLCIYRLKDIILLETLNTSKNNTGLCCVSNIDKNIIIAYLSPIKGRVNIRIFEIDTSENTNEGVPFINFKTNLSIYAHDNSISCINLSNDGKLLATTSTKGTIIRLFNTFDGVLINEFRRGTKHANILSLNISDDNNWLCLTSSSNTVHVFSIYKTNKPLRKVDIISKGKNVTSPVLLHYEKESKNRKSSFKCLLPCHPYLNSDWSFATFKLPGSQIASICAFVNDQNCIIVICSNGVIYKLRFNEHVGGDMYKISSYNFE